MSVINRVLKDLDRSRAMSGTPSGVRAVTAERRTSIWIWVVLAALLLGSAAGFVLRQYRVQQPLPPSPASPRAEAMAEPTQALAPTEMPVLELRAAPSLLESTAEPESEPAAAQPAKQPSAKVEVSAEKAGEMRPRVVKEPSVATPEAMAQAEFNQARRMIEQGRKQDAMERLYASLQHFPSLLPARQMLIVLLAEGADRARVEALIREGAALHPSETWFAQATAQLQVQQGDYAAAAATLKAGLSRGPAAGAYWAFLAGVQNKLGRMEEVAQSYRQALHLHPENGVWWVGLAVALEQQGRKEEARSAYLEASRTKLNSELKGFVGQKLAELAR